MIATRTKNGLIYTREKWYEWLMVKVSFEFIRLAREGEMIPRWYLPISREWNTNTVRCWIFPLAPFVIVGTIFYRMMKGVWSDILEISETLRLKTEKPN